MIEPAAPRHQHVCPCGHKRQDHVDAYSKCDACDCRAYRGHIDELPDPTVWAPPGLLIPGF